VREGVWVQKKKKGNSDHKKCTILYRSGGLETSTPENNSHHKARDCAKREKKKEKTKRLQESMLPGHRKGTNNENRGGKSGTRLVRSKQKKKSSFSGTLNCAQFFVEWGSIKHIPP